MKNLIQLCLLLIAVGSVVNLKTQGTSESKKHKDKDSKKSSKTKHHNDKSKLIEASQLKELIDQSNFNETHRLLEASVDVKMLDEFKKEHIPNSMYFDALKGSNPTGLCPMNIPEIDQFKEYVSSLGISNNHKIIIYDRSEPGIFEAARVWWIFKIYGYDNVQILNGGLKAWKNVNLPLTDQIVTFTPENFSATLMKNRLRTFDEVFENTKAKKEILIDARDAEDFNKIDETTNNTMNIPNSINLPFKDLFDMKNSKLKSPKELKSLFKSKKIDLKKKPIIVSCLKGMRAGVLGFVANSLGAKQVAIYPGSWLEYSQKVKEMNLSSGNTKSCEL